MSIGDNPIVQQVMSGNDVIVHPLMSTGEIAEPPQSHVHHNLAAMSHYKQDTSILSSDGTPVLSYFDNELDPTKNPFQSGAQRWLIPSDTGYKEGIDPEGIFLPDRNDTDPNSPALQRLRDYNSLREELATDDGVISFADLEKLDAEYLVMLKEIPPIPGMTPGVIALIVVGILVPLGMIFLVVWHLYCRSIPPCGCHPPASKTETTNLIASPADTKNSRRTTSEGAAVCGCFAGLAGCMRRRLPSLEANPIPARPAVPNSLLVLSCVAQVMWIVFGYFLFKRYRKSQAAAARRIPLHN